MGLPDALANLSLRTVVQYVCGRGVGDTRIFLWLLAVGGAAFEVRTVAQAWL